MDRSEGVGLTRPRPGGDGEERGNGEVSRYLLHIPENILESISPLREAERRYRKIWEVTSS